MHSSRLEGGANVVSEAIVASTPVIASRIAGNVGLLGEDYLGYFEVGDISGLARLLLRAETDVGFLAELKAQCEAKASLFYPVKERIAWNNLLGEINKATRR